MEKKHPIENLMMTAMTSLESMVDVNTIIGETVTSPDGTIIIPISKVCFGFAAGGSEFNSNKLNKFSENGNLPFGGGSGAGVNISPMAFLVVKDGIVKLLTMDSTGPIDKLIELIPEAMDKVENVVKNIGKNDKKSKIKHYERLGSMMPSNQKEEQSPDDFDDDL